MSGYILILQSVIAIYKPFKILAIDWNLTVSPVFKFQDMHKKCFLYLYSDDFEKSM